MYSLINIKFFNNILKKFKKNKINSDTYISNNRIDSEMKVIDLKAKTKYNSRDRSLDIVRNSNDEYEVILDHQRTNIKRNIKFPTDNDFKKDKDIIFPSDKNFEDFQNLQIEFLKHSNVSI